MRELAVEVRRHAQLERENISAMQHKSERAAPPYGDCIEHDTAERSLLLDKNYTMETCIASCVQRKTVEVHTSCFTSC